MKNKFKIILSKPFGNVQFKGKHLHYCDFIRGGFINPITKTVYIPYNKEYYNDFLIKHECGHVEQLTEYGLFRYIFCIGIPSIISFTTDRKRHMSYPYELDATKRCGADRTSVKVTKEYY